MEGRERILEDLQEAFIALTERFLEQGASLTELKSVSEKNQDNNNNNNNSNNNNNKRGLVCHYVFNRTVLALFAPIFCSILFKYSYYADTIKSIRGTRCLVPNNYFVWEFTRPISDCDYCKGVEAALILPNLTRQEFKRYAYSSRPMVVKHAASGWPASKMNASSCISKATSLACGKCSP